LDEEAMQKKPEAFEFFRRHFDNKPIFEKLTSPRLTDDGLLPCSMIRIRKHPDGYDLVLTENEEVSVFPVPECFLIADYLVDHLDLWSNAALHVTYAPTIFGSAPMFGVPFKKAVSIALKRGHMKSKFFIPENTQKGRVKSLLLQLNMTDDIRGEMLQLQAWQYNPPGSYAHYLHALSTDFDTQLYHLDGATIKFSEADLDTLLNQSKKVKGDKYIKHFRIDGQIDIAHLHHLAHAFLPGRALYDEAFELAIQEQLYQ
jgi:hypothetical protein